MNLKSTTVLIRTLLVVMLTFLLLFNLVSCGTDPEPAPEPSKDRIKIIRYKTEGIISREYAKDSLGYSENDVTENIRTRKAGAKRRFNYQYESDGSIKVFKDGSESIYSHIDPPVGNIQLMHMDDYSTKTASPTYLKYQREGNVLIITRWEYLGAEEVFDMETEGVAIKRMVITFGTASGLVEKINVFVKPNDGDELKLYTSSSDFIFDETENPLFGLRMEYYFLSATYINHHTLVEYYNPTNAISYKTEYFDEHSGQLTWTNYYNFSYTRDQKDRITSSKISLGDGEYFDDIEEVIYYE